MRIVSLLPSATEIVFALGLEDQLEGVTDECDWPPAARQKRIVVRSRQPSGLTPREIDAWVEAAASGGGLYELDDAAIAEIRPDLILTQDLCRVCAVPTGDVDAALARIGCPSTVVTLEPQRLDEVIDSVGLVARAAGVEVRGKVLMHELRERLTTVSRAIGNSRRVPTLVLEWVDPPFTAGHWIPDVVEAAGGISLLGDAGGRSCRTTWDEVATIRPGIVVLSPCGVPPATVWEQASLVPEEVPAERTVAVDLARPGPRLVDGVEALAAVLHPQAGLPPRPDVLAFKPVVSHVQAAGVASPT
jgi:iron complex transport system substrate-binding protein